MQKIDISFHLSWRIPDTGYGTGRKTSFRLVFKALDQQGFIFLDLGQSFLDQLIERPIVPPLTFFEVEIEVLLDVVEFAQATFGKTPEGFDPVDEPPLGVRNTGPC